MPLPQCSDNTDKVLTRYIRARDGTKLVLNYRHQEAVAIRSALQRIRLKGDKTPSLSLIARRSMSLYIAQLESSPAAFESEVQALEELATPVATRKQKAPMSDADRRNALSQLIGLPPGCDAGRSE